MSATQPDRWPADYTTELVDLLHVLGLLVGLEASQAALLEQVCIGATISDEELRAAGALGVPDPGARKRGARRLAEQPRFLD